MKIVICGLWHVHAEIYYRDAIPFAEILGVYDEDKQRREEFAARFGTHAFGSMEELLESGADGAIVCTSTDTHTETILRLVEAGMDIFSEKVLALTEEECDRIADAVQKKGVRFVISLPHKYNAGQRTVKMVADSGELGRINYFRYRNVHSGSAEDWLPEHFYERKTCGGGAMIDLGAHGMYLADWFCGVPEKVTSMFSTVCSRPQVQAKNRDKVEDNAITMMKFADGCIAINETGFVSMGSPIELEVGGEEGFVTFNSLTNKVIKNVKATGEMPVEVELCPALPSPLQQFCTGEILEGCGIEEARRLTHLMVMAYQNAQ